MHDIRKKNKTEPYSIKEEFKRERVPAGVDDIIVRSTCLKCGNTFIADLRNELMAGKETEHMKVCSGRIKLIVSPE